MKIRPTKINKTERQRKKQRKEVDKTRTKTETRDKPTMKGGKKGKVGMKEILPCLWGIVSPSPLQDDKFVT
jgi:hypothetical protein